MSSQWAMLAWQPWPQSGIDAPRRHRWLRASRSSAGAAAIRFSVHLRRRSPFDPLLFGMLGARAMALVRLGRFDEAAGWALKASARPNAHPHIQAIAAYSLPLAEWLDETRAHLGVVHASRPRYGIDVFLPR